MAEFTTVEVNQRTKRRTRLSAKRKAALDFNPEDNKRQRTFDDFFGFCSFVLAYEEKLAMNSELCEANGNSSPQELIEPVHPQQQQPQQMVVHESHCVSHSAGESTTSPSSASSTDSSGEEGTPTKNEQLEYTSDDESWNLVTCFCRRPFAGRPMVECASCQTWVHLFCAKLKKSEIPEVYVCPKCSPNKQRTCEP